MLGTMTTPDSALCLKRKQGPRKGARKTCETTDSRLPEPRIRTEARGARRGRQLGGHVTRAFSCLEVAWQVGLGERPGDQQLPAAPNCGLQCPRGPQDHSTPERCLLAFSSGCQERTDQPAQAARSAILTVLPGGLGKPLGTQLRAECSQNH